MQAQPALHAANPQIAAFYEHYSDSARPTPNDESRDADAVVDAELCGLWVDRVRRCCLVQLTGWKPSILRVLLVFVRLHPLSHFPSLQCSHSRISEPCPKLHTLVIDYIYPIPLPVIQALSSLPCMAVLYASFQSTNFLAALFTPLAVFQWSHAESALHLRLSLMKS